MLAAEEADEAPPGADEAARDLAGWLELNCGHDAAGEIGDPRNRRVAPLFEATPEGFEICFAGSMFASMGSDVVGAVLYGDTTAEDPYAGEMLGVVWGTDGGHAGDGERTPVVVRGVEGVAAPITVFQQVVLEDLGMVIAWEEAGEAIGPYGRGFDQSRVAELLDVAEDLSSENGVFELAPESLPSGFGEIYRGSVDSLSLVLPVGAAYSISYQNPDTGELLTLSGEEMSADEFDALRFLTLGLQHEDLEGRDAIIGNAWNDEGPAVVTWREPEGFVVRLVGLSTDLGVVRDVARTAQELDRGQWEDIVNGASTCHGAPSTE
ncbi:MAG: hypothetical protein AAGD33_20145 [Actinomycetota bacterium]